MTHPWPPTMLLLAFGFTILFCLFDVLLPLHLRKKKQQQEQRGRLLSMASTGI